MRLAGFLFLFYSACVIATPSGKDLLAACDHALVNNFMGVNGTMCAWYVVPCDCDTMGKILPRVCVPVSVTTSALAEEVVKGLRTDPELLLEDADMAAMSILSRVYTCTE